jgi:hypothetical protein
MAKNSIYDYSTSVGSNTDIAGIGILGTNAVNNFDDAFRTIMAQIATDVSPRRFSIQGGIYGLTLSNNVGDAVNDIDIAVGMAATDSTTDPRTMVLASALTKRLDAAWAVGTNAGGLDTGAIANAWYYMWLIQRSDTGVVDALFSLSATAPTMPTNYDRKRRIGSILRSAASIQAFVQTGDNFDWLNIPQDFAVTNPGVVPVNRTVTVPPNMYANILVFFQHNDAATLSGYFVYRTDVVTRELQSMNASAATGRATNVFIPRQIKVDASSQIRTNVITTSNANTIIHNYTTGYVDTRGRI